MLSAAAILSLMAIASGTADVQISQFGETRLEDWTVETFDGETRYTIVEEDGMAVLLAESDDSASGIYRKVSIDLEETPCLHWKWKITRPLVGLKETTKAGDDYAARIYAIKSGGLAFWQTRTLSYVWAGQQPEGSSWPNAFTDQSTMIAVRSGDSRAGEWTMETRNVREDFRSFAGFDAREIDAVAIMTDTDNSNGYATARYADIRFSNEC